MWRLKEKKKVFVCEVQYTYFKHIWSKQDQLIFFCFFLMRSIYLLFMRFFFLFLFFFNMCTVFAFNFFFFLLFFYFYKGSCKGFGIRHVGNNACSWCSCFYSHFMGKHLLGSERQIILSRCPWSESPMGFHSSFVCLLHQFTLSQYEASGHRMVCK